jgi:hypothetical protein
MPEEIKLNGGTPFAPVGTVVGCDDPDPVIPVPELAADIDEMADAPAPDAVVRGAADAADAV